ncbi:MAG TPA: hypothetical protein VGO45_10810 [Bacteroidia bacterium]|jgi:hypothetical protein|nr:hypothetical protein [Bacteroidia bacterium]
MKKKNKEALKKKLFSSITSILEKDQDSIKRKTKKAIRKSIRRILKKTDKQKKVRAVSPRS